MENNTTFVLGPIQTKWLESLEQHPERQTDGFLGKMQSDGSYKACCLGELGLISGKCEWNEGGELVVIDAIGYRKDIYLLNVYEELGLNSDTGAYEDDADKNKSLSMLNDNGKTWPEIAAIVRANPTKYFTKSV